MLRKLLLLASVLALGLGLWIFWYEQTTIQYRYKTLTSPKLATDHPSLKVVILSDLHVGSPYWGTERVAGLVTDINKLTPDIILILGDFLISNVVGGQYTTPFEIKPLLQSMEARNGKFAVLGNHDWWEDGPGMIAALQNAGFTVLEGQRSTLDISGITFSITGIPDDMSQRPDIRHILCNISLMPDHFNIVMTHDPGVYKDLPSDTVIDLMLAGHTHGGQVNFPLIGPQVIPGRATPEWAHCLIETRNGPLLVTSGLGTSILPVRFLRPPEVVVLTLAPATR